MPPPPASPPQELKAFLQSAAQRSDADLTAFMVSREHSPAKLTESMTYSLLGRGTGIRPARWSFCAIRRRGTIGFCDRHATGRSHRDDPLFLPDPLTICRRWTTTTLRRGRPTNHKVFGDALAILAGDALATLPYQLLTSRVSNPALAVKLIRELAHATGPEGMIGGQVLDTCHPAESRAAAAADGERRQNSRPALEDLQRIHRMKTGALIRCACRMGALCANPSAATLDAIDTYGRAIGLAFQIVDDILDVTSTPEQMGKNTNKDAAIGKLTYPSLVGLERARDYLAEQVRVSEQVAAQLGPHATLLSQLAHDLANRTHYKVSRVSMKTRTRAWKMRAWARDRWSHGCCFIPLEVGNTGTGASMVAGLELNVRRGARAPFR